MLFLALPLALTPPVHAEATPEDHVMINQYGAVLHWEKAEVGFVVDPRNMEGLPEDGVTDAAVDAGEAWNEIETVAIEFAFDGRMNGFKGGYDEQSGVYFVDDWTSSPDLLALTTTWSNQDGVILDFDLEVNTGDHDWALESVAGKADLQNTLAHEFGHALGAGHIEGNDHATMYPASAPGETIKRDLDDADVAVAEWLYPDLPEGASLDDDRPFGACSTVPATFGWMAAPAALLAFFRRKVNA